MRRWLDLRLVRFGLWQLAALAVHFLLNLPSHFLIGTPLYVEGLFWLQLPLSSLAIYALLYGVLPRLLRGQRLAFAGLLALWLPGSLLLAALVRATFDFVVGPHLLGHPPAPPFSWSKYLNPSGFNFFMMLTMAGAAATLEVLSAWYRQQRQKEQLVQRRLGAELQLLKTQLQPAFLFTTLHTLRTLTAEKSAQAPAAVLHLAALLRYLLYESPHETVPLADEVAMLRDYVALERLRLGARVEVSLNFSGNLGTHRIAPLLLLPFLENAFRHGTGAGLDCAWVSIDLVARPAGLTFKIINSQPPAAPALREGPGLRAVRQRLAHLYAGRHALRITAEPDAFVVALHLGPAPLAAARPAPPAPALTHASHLTFQP